ncbi:alpha/beta hydrolase, partial [Streptomyces sp. NPDC058953]|uniref:alpha/beta hydrolase n=1 Tax=Streptomyces sp. NPDC058953 TaxID=3346676 RepID=UPI00368F3B24
RRGRPPRGARRRAGGGGASGARGPPAEPGVGGVVLILPDGAPESTRGRSPWAHLAALSLGRALARAGHSEGLVVLPVHYSGRGWNGTRAQLAVDAAWAADEVVRRYGDVPVCLVGLGLGGRAALRAAGHAAVASVLAMAPLLPPEGRDAGGASEPVKQLVGRKVMIVHGTNDERSCPDRSYRLAERAKKANRDICRFEVHTDGHALRQHHAEVLALAVDFVVGTLVPRPFSRPVADALAAPPPLGLRMPLAAGFGKSLRP